MDSSSFGVSGECRHDRASALQLPFLGQYVMVNWKRVKNNSHQA